MNAGYGMAEVEWQMESEAILGDGWWVILRLLIVLDSWTGLIKHV